MEPLPPAPSAPSETPDETIRRLAAELREARDQQAATTDILEVINSSPGDLRPVFDAILEKAHSLCGIVTSSLQLFDGKYFRGVAFRGAPEALARRLREGYRGRDNPIIRPLLDSDRFVQVPDLDEIDDARLIISADAIKTRTLLCIPLRKGDALLGMITAGRMDVRPFTEKEVALIESFAMQAVIAMENARLLTETREALEQQTATAEVLQVINSSPGDLAPVFDAILEKARDLCEAVLGNLNTFDGERFHIVALQGVPSALEDLLRSAPPQPGPNSPPARMLRGEDVVRIDDLAASLGYQSGEPRARAMVDLGGVRSYVGVALRKDTKLLGTIAAYRKEVRPFSDKQIALLQSFAAQAVIAMENARLLTETREALEQQTATAEVLQIINSSPADLAPVFDAILEKAHRLADVAYGSLHIYDGEYFHAAATHGLPEAFANVLRQGFRGADAPMTWPLLAGEHRLVYIPDLMQTEHPMARAAVDLGGVRTGLFVPLRRDDVLLGMIVSGRKEVRPFSEKQIALLESFARHRF
jgi:GAF domain-containing protein